MTKKKAKRKLKMYVIEVRVDMSYTTEVYVDANNILNAGRKAMKMAREEAISAVPGPSYISSLNHADVMIEGGEEIDNG